jgi:pyrroline-5-carboxylate reductase
MGAANDKGRPVHAQHSMQGAVAAYHSRRTSTDNMGIYHQIREGMTVVSNLPTSEHAERDRAIILKIFSSIGRCRFMDEKHFDACTALSGSGPAFASIFMEAMTDGGVMMGLPRAEALELAAQSASFFLSLA